MKIQQSDQWSVTSGQKRKKELSRTTQHSSLGFTFMELMVVVAIIGMLIFASMPAFRNFARGRNIKEGATMITSALRRSREAAITYRRNYRVLLDTVNQAVAIDNDTDFDINTNGLAEKWEKLPEFVRFDTTPPLLGVWDITDVYTISSIYYLEFKPNGGLQSGMTAKNIRIIEEDTGDSKVIETNGLTGRIKIE